MRIRMHSFTFYIRFYSHPIAFPLFTILPSICNLHELPDSTGFYILLLLLLFPFARCFLLLIVVGAISLRCGKWSSTSSGEDLWCYIMADCGEVDMAIIIMPSNRSRIQGMLCMTGWGGGIRWSSVVREMIHIYIYMQCMYYMHGCMSLITITNHYNRIKLHLSICDSSRQRSEKKSRKKKCISSVLRCHSYPIQNEYACLECASPSSTSTSLLRWFKMHTHRIMVHVGQHIPCFLSFKCAQRQSAYRKTIELCMHSFILFSLFNEWRARTQTRPTSVMGHKWCVCVCMLAHKHTYYMDKRFECIANRAAIGYWWRTF